MEKLYDGPTTAKLGTKKKPAIVRVQTDYVLWMKGLMIVTFCIF